MQEETSDIIETLTYHALAATEIVPFIEGLPEASSISPAKLEYELRLLKIIALGWGLSYYLGDGETKETLLQGFWREIYSFSQELDRISLASGIEISYFSMLEERFNAYLARVKTLPMKDIFKVAGLCLAEFCGDEKDFYVLLVGKKVFTESLKNLQTYLANFEMISGNAPKTPSGRQDP